ncbi:MAG: hypothetical protein GY834_04540 [Bacteroidetes bacterium]|nr:hypothetical protein [Bacteroidota bacterium]
MLLILRRVLDAWETFLTLLLLEKKTTIKRNRHSSDKINIEIPTTPGQ